VAIEGAQGRRKNTGTVRRRAYIPRMTEARVYESRTDTERAAPIDGRARDLASELNAEQAAFAGLTRFRYAAEGIAGEPALVRTADDGVLDTALVDLGQFNHMIARVQLKDRVVWVDPTASNCAPGYLPGGDQATFALVASPLRSRMEGTPLHDAGDSPLTRTLEATLGADGRLVGRLVCEARGEAALEYRNAIQQDPRFGEARFKLAATYLQLNEPQNAYREFIRAERDGSGDSAEVDGIARRRGQFDRRAQGTGAGVVVVQDGDHRHQQAGFQGLDAAIFSMGQGLPPQGGRRRGPRPTQCGRCRSYRVIGCGGLVSVRRHVREFAASARVRLAWPIRGRE